MIDLGVVKPGSTLRIPFSSFDKDDGSSITMTNYAAADILIYKDGGTTERASTAGFTATTDFDSKTGKHLAIIDLADNTTAGFFAAGSEYVVAIDAVTVDAVTTGGWIARFVIGYENAVLNTTIATLASQTSFTLTAGPAEDDALNGMWCIIHDVASAVQWGRAIIVDYTGSTKTVTLAAGTTFTAAATDNISVMGLAPLQPATAGRTVNVSATGVADADMVAISTDTAAADNLERWFDGTVGFATSGSNLALGAFSMTTLTASGAVAFQSTFAVTTSTSLAALSCTTLTASGAVAFQSTFGITGAFTSTNASNDIVGIDVAKISGSATAANNMEVVYDTDFATNYNSTDNLWYSQLADNIVHGGTAARITLGGSTASGILRIVNAGGAGVVVTGTTRGVSVSASAGYGVYFSGTTAGGIFLGSTTNGDGAVFQSGGGTGDDVALDGDGVIAGYTAQTGDSYARLGAPAGASVSADIADLPTNAELATALGTADDATLAAIAALSIPTAAQNATAVLDKALSSHQTAGTAGKAIYDADLRGSRTVVRGTVTTGASTTSIPTSAFSPAGGVADQFKGRIVVFDNDTTTATLRGQATDITASSNSSTPTLTVTALAATPASGDTFSIV